MNNLRKLLVLTSLFLVPLVIPMALPRVSAATGLVCIADPSVNPSSCPTSPASFSGTAGSDLIVAVNIQGSDTLNGFDITTLVDPSVLQPVAILTSSSILGPPNFVCVQTVDAATGTAHYCVVVFNTIPGPVTGNLFNIQYKVLTSTSGTEIAFLPGCSNTSVPNKCVSVAGPNLVPETVQIGSLSGPVTPGFILTVNLKSKTLTAGQSTFTTIIASSFNEFVGTVNLSTSPPPTCQNCPTWSIAPTSLGLSTDSAASANFTIQTTKNTPPGTYNAIVNGTSGTLNRSVGLSFTVTGPPPPPPDFSLSSNPASLTIKTETSGTSTITIGSINSFNGVVTLSASVSPVLRHGITVSLSPTSINVPANGQATSTLTVTAAGSTQMGTYTVTVTATGGGITKQTTVTITVKAG